MSILGDYDPEISYKELVSTSNFKLVKSEGLIYPYTLEYFSPAFGWEIVIDLNTSDLAELISLIKQYTEEK